MRRRSALALALALAAAAPAGAAPAKGFQFGVIGHSFKASADAAVLRRAIAEASAGNAAFVVATGIKAASEPCSDKLYGQRRAMFDAADKPMIVSLAGSDWTGCKNSAGRSNAIERLNRLRELYFADAQSLGERRLGLTRQSASAKFRSYAENAHWEYGNVLFATLNLPARNNHFLPEAGRNSEFEDRLVANRAWLHRLFTLAARKHLAGVVLFCDGDPGLQADEGFSLLAGFQSKPNKQDGFAEPRRQLKALAEKFDGKVLLVDAQGGAQAANGNPAGTGGAAGNGNGNGNAASAAATGGEPAIVWRGNLGQLSLAAEWAELRVSPGAAALFTVKGGGADAARQ
ncbi:hypothetical protein CSQ96_03335 [Janthinobacterium sp. BJB412]|nr:hypothetical protein CSQ96_03335 [Janthinobacterium sp. BJB412]